MFIKLKQPAQIDGVLRRPPGIYCSLTVGGQPATVLFAGLAPRYAGLYQVNPVVPQLAPVDYPVQISAGDATSNAATISIR